MPGTDRLRSRSWGLGLEGVTAESPLRGHTWWLRTSCVGAASGEVPARCGAGSWDSRPPRRRRLHAPCGWRQAGPPVLPTPAPSASRPLAPRVRGSSPFSRTMVCRSAVASAFPARRARRQVWWLLGLGSARSGEPRGSVAGPRAAHAWRPSPREALRAGRELGRRRHTWDSFPARIRGPEAEHPAWPGPPIAFWQKGKRKGKPALNSVCLPGTRVTPTRWPDRRRGRPNASPSGCR